MAEPTEANNEAAFTQYWLDQLDGYAQEFKRWEKRCERIVKRYRDDRQEKSDGSPESATKFNALWSNVQTLSPAVYKKAPQPVIERRYLDKDQTKTAKSQIEVQSGAVDLQKKEIETTRAAEKAAHDRKMEAIAEQEALARLQLTKAQTLKTKQDAANSESEQRNKQSESSNRSNSDAMSATALAAVAGALNKIAGPKKIIRGKDGRAEGVE